MSFIAGIVSKKNNLSQTICEKFTKTIKLIPFNHKMTINTMTATSCILFQAGYSGLWRGPKFIQIDDKRLFASTGTEKPGSNMNCSQNTIELLFEWLTSNRSSAVISDSMLHFSAACMFPEEKRLLLANDPLGTATLSYYVNDEYIIFSSRPSLLYRFCNSLTVNFEAVFEFFLLGHFLGNKTFFKEVSLLPPGGLLEYVNGTLKVKRYTKFELVSIDPKMGLEESTDRIVELLNSIISPEASYKTKVNCFLSGGWDSRLLAGLLAKKNQVDCTWTTELLGRYSESRIAYTVADHLGINNQFIPPTFLNLISYFHKHRKLVDYSSDTGPWIMSLLEKIPDGHVYVDGFLVDVLLRPDKHVSPFLLECVNTGNIEGAKEYFLNMYLEAGGPFPSVKAGGRPWQKLLKRDFYEEQAEKLKNNINEEFGDAERGQDFVTSFVMKNRQRRCITALPMLLIGNKGPILLPFCDLELVRLCLNIPLEHKISGRLQFFILEKIKNGLGRLISTNSEKSLLHPYLRKRITYDFTRRFLSWGWLYEKAVTQLDKQILEFLYGGENEAKLRLLRFPYQLTRLLFVQEALALNNSKE